MLNCKKIKLIKLIQIEKLNKDKSKERKIILKLHNETENYKRITKLIYNNVFDRKIFVETCRRVLRNNNFHCHLLRKKPNISNTNKMVRLRFIREYNK